MNADEMETSRMEVQYSENVGGRKKGNTAVARIRCSTLKTFIELTIPRLEKKTSS